MRESILSIQRFINVLKYIQASSAESIGRVSEGAAKPAAGRARCFEQPNPRFSTVYKRASAPRQRNTHLDLFCLTRGPVVICFGRDMQC